MVCYEVCDYFGGVFFFFKQKTAYEMRISDWSSDVCSSDLDDTRHEIIRRLFYLITVAAEDAATLEANGQATGLDRSRIADIAARLRALGETIEIISSAIEALAQEFRPD